MRWVKVDDGNGNVFHALMDFADKTEAWVYFNKKSGFGNDVGECKLITGLKESHNGTFVA